MYHCKAKVIGGGSEVLLIPTGLLTERVLEAAQALDADNVNVAVLHVPTLKPLNEDVMVRELRRDRLVLTCENHTVIGGLS